jgi:Protein of unknown function (DUF2721)
MSVDQTSQLIQLVLNSVLMAIACGLVLLVMLTRHTAIGQQLRLLNRDVQTLFDGIDPLQEAFIAEAVFPTTARHYLPSSVRRERANQLKAQQQHLRQRYRMTQTSMLVTYGALLLLLSNTGLLAFRTLINWDWLVSLSLYLFTGGTLVFLVGVGLALLDGYRSRRSLLEELRDGLPIDSVAILRVKLPLTAQQLGLRKTQQRLAANRQRTQAS